MAAATKILIVDDHYETRDALRRTIIEAFPASLVLAVPSAEEGMLELRGGALDLLLTAVHLPRISGIDLVRRLHKSGQTPGIFLTENVAQVERVQSADLSPSRIIQKPASAADVLSAVNTALGLSPVDTAPLSLLPFSGPVMEKIEKRLQGLQNDIGALGVFLADQSGDIVCQLGPLPAALTADLITLIGENLQNSVRIGALLETADPFTLQYHAGDEIELYFANFDAARFVCMIFDASARRGRISTVYVFTQRALREIKDLLAVEQLPPAVTESPPLPATVQGEPVAASPTTAVNPPVPTPVTPPAGQTPDFIDIAPDQLAALLNESADIDAAVDAFWEDAVEDDTGRAGKGLSFAEAKRQGLIPEDLEEDTIL